MDKNVKNASHFLSLIVPVYRQEKTIVKNIEHIKSVLDTIRYNYEIIVVIDGILDKALDNLKAAKIPHTKILAYSDNQGKSFAIRLGMHHAEGDYVMFMDSGMEIDTSGISMLIEHMEWYNADIIVGSKRHPASLVHYPPIRKILSYGYYFIVKMLFGISIRDTQAGIKLYKKNVIEKILPRLVEKKFAGDLEILVVSKLLGFKRIYEAPIKLDFTLGNVTSAATLDAVRGIFVDTLAIFYRAYFLKYYKSPHQRLISPKDLQIIT